MVEEGQAVSKLPAPSVELTGIHLALSVNVAVTLVSVVLIWFGLRPRGQRRTEVAAVPAPREANEEPAASTDRTARQILRTQN